MSTPVNLLFLYIPVHGIDGGSTYCYNKWINIRLSVGVRND